MANLRRGVRLYKMARNSSLSRPLPAASPVFKIDSTPIDPVACKQALLDVRAGACVTFEGWVRERNEGQAVRSLEYEAYAELAEKEGHRVLAEAKEKFALLSAACVHRVGHLALGDMAIWVGV